MYKKTKIIKEKNDESFKTHTHTQKEGTFFLSFKCYFNIIYYVYAILIDNLDLLGCFETSSMDTC